MVELRREIDSLKQGQNEIQKTLAAVRDILSGKRPSLEDVFVNVAGSPSLGSRDAKITIVEFTDFECPFCGAYARETFGRIMSEYVKTGKVRYVSRNFPLEQSHPLARKAAEVALCAEEQGKYWDLHDRFFADQRKITVDDVPEHAAALGADAAALRQCADSGRYAQKVAADLAEGREVGVSGTPTFFIGYADVKNPSRIKAVRSIPGNAPYREFEKAIGEALEAWKRGAEVSR
jgi:protein-disulfide isomerase